MQKLNMAKLIQDRVDEAVPAIGRAVYDNAERLSELVSVAKGTGMGLHEDKIQKVKGNRSLMEKIKGVKSRNIIWSILEEGPEEIAKPVGVIATVTSAINPTMATAQNSMITLKG